MVLPTMKGPSGRRPWPELPRSREIRLGPVSAIAAGVGIAVLAVAIKGVVRETLGDPGYILLVGAVVTAAWLGGIRAGLTAVATTFVLDSLAFDPASRYTSGEIVARQVVYILVAVATVVLIGSRRAARDRLVDALDETAVLAEALAARDERLELVLEASGTGIWEWDLATDRLEWSEEIYRQHGMDMGDAVPHFDEYLRTIHPADLERFRDAIDIRDRGRHALRHGVPYLLAGRVGPLDARLGARLPRSRRAPSAHGGHWPGHHGASPPGSGTRPPLRGRAARQRVPGVLHRCRQP